MKRFHLFEFEDLSWFPDILRRPMLDYLAFFLRLFKVYRPVVPEIARLIETSGETEILDLCSGSGGSLDAVQEEFKRKYNRIIPVTFSDKYPNIRAYQRIKLRTGEHVNYLVNSVDATNVSPLLPGLRALFSSFHHFKPDEAAAILQNAAQNRKTIAVFDGGDRNLFPISVILLVHPVLILLSAPFLKPFSISRLFFTFIIPLIPFCTVWDGIISIMRLYTPEQMLKLARQHEVTDYVWQSGRIKHPLGFHISYLYGYPEKSRN